MANVEKGSMVDAVDANTPKAPLLPDLAQGVKNTAMQVAGVATVVDADADDDDSGYWPDGDVCIRMPSSERPTPCK